MSDDALRLEALDVAECAAQIMHALVVGMECNDIAEIDTDAALSTLPEWNVGHVKAALLLLSADLYERGIEPCDVFERIPRVVSLLALRDL
jgi:hypothetical protein